MKKSLVALASLAAASAFAGVSITGTFDPSLMSQQVTYGNNIKVTTSKLSNNSQGTSNVTFSGSEDLGGGLKASFLVENDFVSTGSAGIVGGGQQYLGLEGGFGSIKLGAANTPSLSVSGRSPFGTKIGSGFGGVQGLKHVREDGSIVYTSPSMGGLTIGYGWTPGSTAMPAANANPVTGQADVKGVTPKTDLGITYANGPLKAMIAFYDQADVYKQTHGYVSFNAGAVTITYGMNKDDKLADTAAVALSDTKAASTAVSKGKRDGQNLALSFNMGAATLMANVGKLDDKTADNADRSISAFGVKYALSKNTSVYARYVDEKLENDANAWALKNVKTTLVGMQTNF
jgi:predicted porin